jgi:hypothetical protein
LEVLGIIAEGGMVDWHALMRSIAPMSAIQRKSLRPIWPSRIFGPLAQKHAAG